MKLTNDQNRRVLTYMNAHGLQNSLLKSDLTDHLFCKIEELITIENQSFDDAFELAKAQCMPNGPNEFERDLHLLTTQKPNIMIRKIAFLGGYLSALCLCLSILFFTLSSFKNKKNALRMNSAQIEYDLSAEAKFEPQFQKSTQYEVFEREYLQANVKSYNQYVTGERLLIVSVLLLVTTFLPYLFFSGYKKQSPEVQTI